MTQINICQPLSPEKVKYLTACSIPDCDRRVYRYRVAKWHSRPLCQSHYWRLSRFGHPLSGPEIKPRRLPPKKYMIGLWKSLKTWVRKYGLLFKIITCKRLGTYYHRMYIAVPHYSVGPRAGSSLYMYDINTVLCWERLGWTQTAERGDGWRMIRVVQTKYDGDRLPTVPDDV